MVYLRLPSGAAFTAVAVLGLILIGCKKIEDVGQVPDLKLPKYEKPTFEEIDYTKYLNNDLDDLFKRPCEKSVEEMSLKGDEEAIVLDGDYEVQDVRLVLPDAEPILIKFDPNDEDSFDNELWFSSRGQVEVIYEPTTPEDVKKVRVESERVCQTSGANWVAEDDFSMAEEGRVAQASEFTTSGRLNLVLTDSGVLVSPVKVGVLPGLNRLNITYLGECKKSKEEQGQTICIEENVLKTQSLVVDYQIVRKHIPGERVVELSAAKEK